MSDRLIRFTAIGPLKHWDEVDRRLIVMADGETLPLRANLAHLFESQGWGYKRTPQAVVRRIPFVVVALILVYGAIFNWKILVGVLAMALITVSFFLFVVLVELFSDWMDRG